MTLKKILMVFASLMLSVVTFAANSIVGEWNIKNLLDFKSFTNITGSQNAGLFMGVLGTCPSVKFNADGTFYCNDSVSGTYSLTGTDLILVRDRAQVEAFRKTCVDSLKSLTSEYSGSQIDSVVNSMVNGYAIDTLSLSFNNTGHKALAEYNQEQELARMLPLTVAYVMNKKGTGAEKEYFNTGKSIVGKWTMNMMFMTITMDFKANGICETTSNLSPDKFEKTKYKVSGDKIIVYKDEKSNEKDMDGEFYISTPQNRVLLIMEKDGAKMPIPLWKNFSFSTYNK